MSVGVRNDGLSRDGFTLEGDSVTAQHIKYNSCTSTSCGLGVMYLRPKNKKEIWGGTQEGPIPLMLCRRLPVLVLVWGLVVMSQRPHQHKM